MKSYVVFHTAHLLVGTLEGAATDVYYSYCNNRLGLGPPDLCKLNIRKAYCKQTQVCIL